MYKGSYNISREIGIDMGHRVPTHGSKCANLHGHRYRVIASCISAELIASGEQTDMVLDFGFLKTVMMDKIDAICDHGMTLWVDDPWLEKFLVVDNLQHVKQLLEGGRPHVFIPEVRDRQTKLCIVPFIPTAERLAGWWHSLMVDDVTRLSGGQAILEYVRVFETPNCEAVFLPE